MAKTPKKRNKPYRGEDAASATPNVRRYTAVERNVISQWWYDRKRVVKPVGIFLIVLVVFIWLVIETLRIIF